MSKIPVSVIVVTRNEEARIGACLKALQGFDDLWVVDSNSIDRTAGIARELGANVVGFTWDGRYPKKRQWCLEHLNLAHDWVFFVDADEGVGEDLVAEIAALSLAVRDDIAGCFVQGHYLWNGVMLRHGLRNQKIALINREMMEFPKVDDLDIEGMGEIEGHYQPVLKVGFKGKSIGKLQHFLIHDACKNWETRHLRYAVWEAGMDAKGAWPEDPLWVRHVAKLVFKALPFRGGVAFLHSYVWKLGFLDGEAGYDFARSRMRYYDMIKAASKTSKAMADSVEG